MSNVIAFPERRVRPHLEQTHGVDKASGASVHVLDYVSPDGGRLNVGTYASYAEFDRAVQQWLDGGDVDPWPDGAA